MEKNAQLTSYLVESLNGIETQSLLMQKENQILKQKRNLKGTKDQNLWYNHNYWGYINS